MKLLLPEIYDLACRFVPAIAADRRLYDSGHHSWWPAHEIGHFLVATRAECRERKFGIDAYAAEGSSEYRYMVIREIAAISISQRLLRRAGHDDLADDEIQYTDESTLDCSFESWCQRAARALLRANRSERLPATLSRFEALLVRKAREVDAPTTYFARTAVSPRGYAGHR